MDVTLERVTLIDSASSLYEAPQLLVMILDNEHTDFTQLSRPSSDIADLQHLQQKEIALICMLT